MAARMFLACFVWGLLQGCTTPYRPPVHVRDSTPYAGLAEIARGVGEGRAVDVLYVHGMCTHTTAQARKTLGDLAAALQARIEPGETSSVAPGTAIELVSVPARLDNTSIRFTAVVWSPLTTTLKRQLDFDHTGEPTDCATAAECKPQRARLNGQLTDTLLDDCLADALIYQGHARTGFVGQMQAAIAHATATPSRQPVGRDDPLVLISESLGSKMVFDALTESKAASNAETQTQTQTQALARAGERLRQVFMLANQLPILGLADQTLVVTKALAAQPPMDSLQKFLDSRRNTLRAKDAAPSAPLTLVAFTDPNDLLSYSLRASRYASGTDVLVADVLVSNDSTVLGWLERPDTAHTGYAGNRDVIDAIACGHPLRNGCAAR